MTRKIIAAASLSLWLLGACTRGTAEFAATREFPGRIWERTLVPSFDYTAVSDGAKDFYVYLENTNEYPYSNIYLIVRTDKNGKLFADTLEYEMTDGRGRWLGTKVRNAYENLLVFKWNVPVRKGDSLHFEIEQATRRNDRTEGDERLPGVQRIGIVVKPHEEKQDE
ncbi:MAG: gliding motility lipoprotein GldH [Chlorobi bacterium]|nr:gliding motility lipoprotein GldH [Chlorobiota bacterium]